MLCQAAFMLGLTGKDFVLPLVWATFGKKHFLSDLNHGLRNVVLLQEVSPSNWAISAQMACLSAGLRTQSLRVSRRMEISFWFFIWFLFLWFLK
jgi:hypothetical protein